MPAWVSPVAPPATSRSTLPSALPSAEAGAPGAPVAPVAALARPPEVAAIVEALPHPAWLVDAAGLVIVAANAAAARLMGRERTELVGGPVSELAATPEDEVFWREAAAGLTDGIDSETWVRGAGGLVLVQRRVSRLRCPAGDAPGAFLVVVEDISAARRRLAALERNVDELQAALEAAADGILVTDLAGRIRHFNRRFAALWELPEALTVVRDDDAVLDAMRVRVADPAAYMRRLAAESDVAGTETGEPEDVTPERIDLRSGRVLERISRTQRLRGLAIGRVDTFRELPHRGALLGLPRRVSAMPAS